MRDIPQRERDRDRERSSNPKSEGFDREREIIKP